MRRRTVNYDDDADRIEEQINRRTKGLLDRNQFKVAFAQYMGGIQPGQEKLEAKAWQRHVFKQGKGKDLKKDQQRQAKTLVETPEQYVKKGASKVDLPGVDTPKKVFTFAGKQKNKVGVYARPITVYIKGKPQRRYIDRRGRYVSIKKSSSK